jgi:hypothetical protein
MNRFTILSLAAFLALNTSADAKSKVYTVSFDGTCDVVTMTYDRAQVLYATLHTSSCAATKHSPPSSNPIPGVGIVVKRNPGSSNARDLAVTETTPGDSGGTPAVAFMYKLDYPLTSGGAWAAYYTSDGQVITKGASGTYTLQ